MNNVSGYNIKNKSKLFKWKHVLIISLLCIIAYSNTLNNAYLHDDRANFLNNNMIKSLKNLPKLFSPEYFALAQEKTYRPVVTLSYFINYFICKLNKPGWHITNMVFHLGNAILVYLLFLFILNDEKTAFITSLFFCLHPVNTEAVNIISFREDLLSLFFFLVSFLFFLKYLQSSNKSKPSWLLSLCFFFISLFTKEMAITLPFILIVYEYVFNNRGGARFLKFSFNRAKSADYLGYFVIMILFLAQRALLLKPSGYVMCTNLNTPAGYPGGSLFTSMLTMTRAVVFYMKLLLMPVKLSVDHLFKSSSHVDFQVIVSALIIAFVFLTMYRLSKSSKTISFSMFFLVITFLPVSNIIPFGAIVFERYLYFTSIGFCLALAALLTAGINNKKIPAGMAVAIITVSYLAGTYTRNADFRDVGTFWSKTLQTNPASVKALNNRGCYYEREGLLEKALDDFNRSIKLKPADSMTYNNRAVVLERMGKTKEAIEDYNTAIGLDPGYSEAFDNRGFTRAKKGRYTSAIEDYNRAIAINPMNPLTYFNRGFAFMKSSLIDNAIADFSRAIELNPDYPAAYFERGASFEKKRAYDKAIEDYSKAIELNPEYFTAYDNRGSIYGVKGLFDKAIEDFTRAIELNPGDSKTYYNRGLAYEKKKLFDKSIKDYSKSIETGPDYYLAYLRRGLAYGAKNNNNKAIADFNRSIELNPGYSEAYKNRGIAYGKKGVNEKSETFLQKAVSDLSIAIELDPGSKSNYTIRSLLYSSLGKNELAEKDRLKAGILRNGKRHE